MQHTVAHYRGYFFLYLGNMKDNPLGNWIHLNILGNDTEANEIIKTLFQFDETLQAQVVSAGHEWTEGPIIVPGTTNNQENDILFFSDVPNDVIWRFEETEGELRTPAKIVVRNSGRCSSARQSYECRSAAEPGSNGITFDQINSNLLICQHGARTVVKLSLNSSGYPVIEEMEVKCNMNLNYQ